MEAKRYILIGKVYTTYPDYDSWAKVAMDIATGERIYLTDSDREEPWKILGGNKLRKIIVGDMEDQYSRYYYATSKFPKRGTEGMSEEVVSSIEQSIDEQLAYKISKGLPTTDLEQNRKKYSVVYDSGIDMFFQHYQLACFSPESISIGIPFKSFSRVDDVTKKRFIQSERHEVGHMGASKIIVLSDTEIQFVVGFCRNVINFEVKEIIGGELLLSPIHDYSEFASEERNAQETALEEITNEFEQKEMYHNYKFHYSNFGSRLNRITNGALQMARYGGGIDFFMESLLKIINDEQKAIELLREIANNVRSDNPQDIAYVHSLMNPYEKAKKRT